MYDNSSRCSKPQDIRGLTFVQLFDSSKTLACEAGDLKSLPGPDIALTLGVMIGEFIISLLMSPLLGHKPSLWITHMENGLHAFPERSSRIKKILSLYMLDE
jgi:hypothetical protein